MAYLQLNTESKWLMPIPVARRFFKNAEQALNL